MARYEAKSVQALRGMESRARTKWEDQGWEFVSESPGTLRTELNFRRVKPKTFGHHLLGIVATFRRLQPKAQSALVASCALILVAGIIGIVAGTRSAGDTPGAARTTASTTPPAASTVTDITVDELVERLNSVGMDGMDVGDRFRVTAELVGSEHWTTGASGDFFVMLKTKTGSDIEVFIDESEASGWRDGTKVDMVLKMVEATIDGETTGGWFRVVSAKTTSASTI